MPKSMVKMYFFWLLTVFSDSQRDKKRYPNPSVKTCHNSFKKMKRNLNLDLLNVQICVLEIHCN